MAREHILIVDDDPDIRDVVKLTLTAEGYEIAEAANGEQALEMVRRRPPHLVVLDYMLPRMDGGEVCQRIKHDILLRHLPIVMLTAKGELTDKIRGIDAGADDYIVKPFEPKELVARVRMVLRKTAQDLDANPLTRLPGNLSIQQTLESRIHSHRPFAVCYADLDKFKGFNDRYGFERGDDAIRETARILLQAVQAHGGPDDFIGHIGGDDFVIVTSPDTAEAICRRVVEEFDRMAPQLYQDADRQRGYILGKNRQGQTVHVPFLSISIGIVTNRERRFSHVAELAEAGAELKAYAKTFEKSIYVTERRKKEES